MSKSTWLLLFTFIAELFYTNVLNIRYLSYIEGVESQTTPTFRVSPLLDFYMPQHVLRFEFAHAKYSTFVFLTCLLFVSLFICQYVTYRRR